MYYLDLCSDKAVKILLFFDKHEYIISPVTLSAI